MCVVWVVPPGWAGCRDVVQRTIGADWWVQYVWGVLSVHRVCALPILPTEYTSLAGYRPIIIV